jgi:hypothetical protein
VALPRKTNDANGRLDGLNHYKGLAIMGKGARAGVALVLAAAAIGVSAVSALAQAKELSDKSVLTLMRYAWGMVPEKFTTPLGKTIEVDKSKASESIVPMDTARDVIRAARLSAYAQLCELMEEQRANYQTLMRREEAKSKWSDQQMLFINQLHLFTMMTLTGKVQLVEKDGDKQVVVQEGKAAKTGSCSDTEKKKVQEQIMAFVNANPIPAAPAAAAAAQPKPEPTPASQKK